MTCFRSVGLLEAKALRKAYNRLSTQTTIAATGSGPSSASLASCSTKNCRKRSKADAKRGLKTRNARRYS